MWDGAGLPSVGREECMVRAGFTVWIWHMATCIIILLMGLRLPRWWKKKKYDGDWLHRGVRVWPRDGSPSSFLSLSIYQSINQSINFLLGAFFWFTPSAKFVDGISYGAFSTRVYIYCDGFTRSTSGRMTCSTFSFSINWDFYQPRTANPSFSFLQFNIFISIKNPMIPWLAIKKKIEGKFNYSALGSLSQIRVKKYK